jgi:hypothetical protein
MKCKPLNTLQNVVPKDLAAAVNEASCFEMKSSD